MPDIENSYMNVSQPTAELLVQLLREAPGLEAARALSEFEEFLKRFAPEVLERNRQILAMAEDALPLRGGALELNANAEVSEGDDNGAYIQTWSWLSFEGSPFDKDKENDNG